MGIKSLVAKVIAKASEKSPEILLGVSVSASITATVLAVKATQKSVKEVKVMEEEAEANNEPRPTRKMIIKKTAKNYILPATALAISISANIMCYRGFKKSIATAATASIAAKVSEETLNAFAAKTESALGKEKTEELLRDSKDETLNRNNDYITSSDRLLCYCLDGVKFYMRHSEFESKLAAFQTAYLASGYDSQVDINELHSFLGIAESPTTNNRYYNHGQVLIDSLQEKDVWEGDVRVVYISFDNFDYKKLWE